jgi:hypothetical protein
MAKSDIDHIELDYNRLHIGLKVSKVGRRGTTREVKLFLTDDHNYIRWTSQIIGMKFGRVNKSKLNHFLTSHILYPSYLYPSCIKPAYSL